VVALLSVIRLFGGVQKGRSSTGISDDGDRLAYRGKPGFPAWVKNEKIIGMPIDCTLGEFQDTGLNYAFYILV